MAAERSPLIRFARRGAASLRRRTQPLVRELRRPRWISARTGDLRVEYNFQAVPPVADLLERLESAPNVVVVIPVYNGGDVVRTCLETVVQFTPGRRIIALDDGSTDAATLAMLDEFAADGRIEVIHNEKNLGYTRTVNRAMTFDPGADVVLLNSDTQVGPLWVERLRATAYSVPRAAGASAFSDNAGAYALPVTAQPNTWPRELGWTAIARFVLQGASSWSLGGPTIHGFCVYLRREALDAVGPFDVKSFPRGYGEENEWSMRALAAGFECLGAPSVFVGHQQGATFGDARNALIRRSRRIIDELHPSFDRLVDQWWHSTPGFAVVRENSASMRDELEHGALARPREFLVGSKRGTSPSDGQWETLAAPKTTDAVRLASALIDQSIERVRGEAPAELARVCALLGVPVVAA